MAKVHALPARRVACSMALAAALLGALLGLPAGGHGPARPGAQPPQSCGWWSDAGPVTNIVHLQVEPRVEPVADQVHAVSCLLAEHGL